MTKRVIILSGVSGSGKSTYVRHNRPDSDKWEVVSADRYFIDECGIYRFDASKLGVAHATCFHNYIERLRSKWSDAIFVDNTNTTVWEISPYVIGAAAFGYEAEIVTLMCESKDDLRMCALRNKHKVSPEVIDAQHKRIRERVLPPFWKTSTLPVKF